MFVIPTFLSPVPLSLSHPLTNPPHHSPPNPHQPPSLTSTTPPKTTRRRPPPDLTTLPIPNFDHHIKTTNPTKPPGLYRRSPTTLQINIGLTCNLACRHCHVGSSPSRTESMSRIVSDRLLGLLKNDKDEGGSIDTVDITGGAPELHGEFKRMVEGVRSLGLNVIDRCNLTVLVNEDGDVDDEMIKWFVENDVRIVASLPCYTVENVEAQRGDGVFDDSIKVLQRLNYYGYGKDGGGVLDLVYNPGGAVLPPPQRQLELDYRRELRRAFGIVFSKLICITNMPIQRFADDLRRNGELREYMELLVDAYNGKTVDEVMCLDMIHVAYDGRVYDCDFNYALGLNLDKGKNKVVIPGTGSGLNVFDVERFADLAEQRIRTGPHCFGCTAGSGSSCGGQVVSGPE